MPVAGSSGSVVRFARWQALLLVPLLAVCLFVYRMLSRPTGTGQPALRPEIDARMFDNGSSYLSQRRDSVATVVVFGDYQCPHTKELLTSPDWSRLLEDQKVSVQWRELPRTHSHRLARAYAVLSKEAVLNGRLAESQPALLQGGSAESVPDLSNLTLEESSRLGALVDADIALAAQLRQVATPLIFVVRGGRVFQVGNARAAISAAEESHE